MEEPFPLFTAHFLPVCFSSELPILTVWVGYTERKGAIPPLPRHSSRGDHSPLQEGGSLQTALLQKSSFSRESMERDNRLDTQLPPQIGAGVQGELPALGKWHPQATWLIKRGPAARAARGRGHPAEQPKNSLLWLHFSRRKGAGRERGAGSHHCPAPEQPQLPLAYPCRSSTKATWLQAAAGAGGLQPLILAAPVSSTNLQRPSLCKPFPLFYLCPQLTHEVFQAKHKFTLAV